MLRHILSRSHTPFCRVHLTLWQLLLDVVRKQTNLNCLRSVPLDVLQPAVDATEAFSPRACAFGLLSSGLKCLYSYSRHFIFLGIQVLMAPSSLIIPRSWLRKAKLPIFNCNRYVDNKVLFCLILIRFCYTPGNVDDEGTLFSVGKVGSIRYSSLKLFR